LPAGAFLPDRRFAAEALPALDAFAGRPEGEAFFDFADLGGFADFDCSADDFPDFRPRPLFLFSTVEAVWRRDDFFARVFASGSASDRRLDALPRLDGATPANSKSILRSSKSTRATLAVTAPPS
jgi:hypothetical protein